MQNQLHLFIVENTERLHKFSQLLFRIMLLLKSIEYMKESEIQQRVNFTLQLEKLT
jgi:hypothetical protein